MKITANKRVERTRNKPSILAIIAVAPLTQVVDQDREEGNKIMDFMSVLKDEGIATITLSR